MATKLKKENKRINRPVEYRPEEEFLGNDGYYEDEGYYEDGEYYEEPYADDGYYEEPYYEDGDTEYYDEEDGYSEDGYYDETDPYADDPDAEYLDDEPYYEGDEGYYEEEAYYEEEPYYEEIDPRRKSTGKKSVSRKNPNTNSANRRKKSHPVLKVVGRVLLFLLVTILLVVFFLYGAVKIILKGPSQAISTQYVSTFHETSALKWLPGLFMTEEEVEAILAKNAMPEVEEGTVSDKDLIVIDETPKEDVEPITLEEIFGTTYHGYMMTIQDPSTVYLGTVDQFAQAGGWVVSQFCEKYGAIGGVNGGEFFDAGSYSYTAWPVGGVISNGKGVFENHNSGSWNLVCMTNENKLLLLKGYSVQQALDMGVRDGVHVKHETGPFLIIDGESLEVPDTEVYGGGKNPRTAIGQRADGAILMCVVDGRQASSLGATFKDMIDIMKDYGAVNAACLDGGTSTQMVYEGEIVNNPYSPTGPRRCPTAWLVGGGNTNE